MRTEDLVKAAACASELLHQAFSLECWGGATFDVSMRFLDECPWQRLREIRAACPNVCLQVSAAKCVEQQQRWGVLDHCSLMSCLSSPVPDAGARLQRGRLHVVPGQRGG